MRSIRPASLVTGACVLLALSVALMLVGVSVGSTGWSAPWDAGSDLGWHIVWRIRAPRCAGAWLAGALLGLAGAVAQGLFRNPLAEPYLLGSASGATLGVASFLAAAGAAGPASVSMLQRLGLTGAAFIGAVAALLLTLTLAKGVQQTLRLLLAGVVVGVVLGQVGELIKLFAPDILRAMQVFMLGTTGFIGWDGVAVMAPILLLTTLIAWSGGRVLDALSLGESTALSLGVRLSAARIWLIAAIGLSTGAAVSHVGLIAFVGLVAPHLVRSRLQATHGPGIVLSALTGGVLLLAADILGRWVLAPQELPVGVLTAVLGGSYLMWRMHRGGARGTA